MKVIPYGRQFIDKQDIQMVSNTLNKDIITSGKEILNFEKKLSNYFKCKYSTVCNSGTSALYLSFLAINLKKKDAIIMPSINFIASYNLAKVLGAKIYLADVNEFNGQMSPKNVYDCIKKFKIKKIKAILTMYNGGYPDNAEKFLNFKKIFKCFIIEDACHALGAEFKKNKRFIKVGSCKNSDISTFSLHPLKTITTGEGGIVTTNSKKIDEKIKKLRSLGISKINKNHWQYEVLYPGFNFRMNEFQCSLGISQLKKINLFLNARKKIAAKYTKELKKINQIITPSFSFNYKSSYHLYFLKLKNKNHKLKEKFIRYMLKNKIILQYHYIPIYKFKIFNGNKISINSEKYYRSVISLPIFYKLSLKNQNYIISKIKNFFNKNV